MWKVFVLFFFIFVVVFFVIIVRIGVIVFELMGLFRDVVVFQVQFVYFGMGFIMSESEYVVFYFVRRKIIRFLIFFGSVGIILVIVMFVFIFVGKSRGEVLNFFVIFVVSFVFLYVFFILKRVERWMRRVIKRFFEKRFLEFKVYDYNQFFGFLRGYLILRIQVKRNSWLVNKMLREFELDKEGVLVFGIFRKIFEGEKYLGVL